MAQISSEPIAHAHCDGPCGVYDPSAARINAEAVLSMTKKLLTLEMPVTDDKEALMAYNNSMIRYVQIKEEQAQKCKEELLILWTDYFKPPHVEAFPELHDTFWKAAKLCSHCKVEVNLQSAEKLMEAVKNIHQIFWKSKDRNVEWVQAS